MATITLEILICEKDGEKWTRVPTRGRKPLLCPTHAAEKKAEIEATKPDRDENGCISVPCLDGHEWMWEVKRGKRPLRCPDHRGTSVSVVAPDTTDVEADEPVPVVPAALSGEARAVALVERMKLLTAKTHREIIVPSSGSVATVKR